jgi:N4-gp56 family major capsid protein
MADTVTSSTDANITTMIGNYYDHVFLERLEATLLYDKWGTQKPLPENEGNTIVWHALLNPAMGYVLSEGATPGASVVSARKVSASLVFYADLRAISDQVAMTAVVPVVEETVQVLGYGAALTKDFLVQQAIGLASAASTGVVNAASAAIPSAFSQGFPLLDGNSNLLYWPASGIATSLQNGFFSTTATITHIRRCVTQLKRYNAMPFDDGNFRGIVHPTVSEHIRSDSNFSTWMAYTNLAAMIKGTLGVIERVLFDESTQAMLVAVTASAWSSVATSVGGSLYGTLVFGRGAYGVSKLGGRDAKIYVVTGADKSDPLNQRTYVGYKLAMAAKILNPSAGVILTWFGPLI